MDRNMANFILTFHIKSDTGYQSRYNSFIKKLKELAQHNWDETTSFYCFESSLTASELCHKLWLESDFNHLVDIMVVIDVKNRVRATKGPLVYPSLLEKYLGF